MIVDIERRIFRQCKTHVNVSMLVNIATRRELYLPRCVVWLLTNDY